jgi:hypothetical protein
MAATKPLGRDILVSKRACSSHFRRAPEWRPSVNDGGCAGEDIARVLAHVIHGHYCAPKCWICCASYAAITSSVCRALYRTIVLLGRFTNLSFCLNE